MLRHLVSAVKRKRATANILKSVARSRNLQLQESYSLQQCRCFSTATTPDGSAGAIAPAGNVDTSSIPRRLCVKDLSDALGSRRTLSAESTPAVPLHHFHNVLTAPRDSADCAVLAAQATELAVLADRTKGWLDRLSALSSVIAAVTARAPAAVLLRDVSLPLLHTQAHMLLLAALVDRAQQLTAGKYQGVNGVACRTVVGERGIGRTNVMLAFTYACKAAYPDIIPLYVSGMALSDSSSFAMLSLEELMIATARAHGVEVEVDEGRGAGALTAALEQAGRRMLIVVDDIDQLYRVPVDDRQPALRLHIMHSLAHLQWLGNQTSGRYSVLVCGSSASTPRLLYSSMPERLTERYPLLKSGVPDLNSTKYDSLPIHSARCTDSKQVRTIADQLGLWPEETDQSERRAKSRILTFFVGATPRAIGKAAESFSSERMAELVNKQLQGTLNPLGDDASLLFAEFLRLVQAENKELIRRLRNPDGTCNSTALVEEEEGEEAVATESGCALPVPQEPSGAWEGLVRPLPWGALESAWSELAKRRRTQRRNPGGYFLSLVDSLQDASLLSVRLDPPAGYCVWPASAAQLVYDHKRGVSGLKPRSR